MIKNKNLWVLFLLLLVGLTAFTLLVRNLMHSTQSASRPATAAAEQPRQQPQPALPSAQTETAEPTLPEQAPSQPEEQEEPLSQQEMQQKLQKIFAQVFSESRSLTLAQTYSKPISRSIAKPLADQWIKMLQMSVSAEALEQMWAQAQQLQEKNDELLRRKHQKEREKRLQSLPLNRENLSFEHNAYGSRLSREEDIPCPPLKPIQSAAPVCRKYVYQDGLQSVAVFSPTFLLKRTDTDKDGRLLYESLYLYPSACMSNNDACQTPDMWTYSPSPDRLITVRYNKQGLPTEINQTDLRQLRKYIYQYAQQGFLSSYTDISPSDSPLAAQKPDEQIFFEKDADLHTDGNSSPDSTVRPEGSYEKYFTEDETRKKASGRWHLNENDETVLDNGRLFPSRVFWGKAPRYCDLYPYDCQPKQSPKIAIIN